MADPKYANLPGIDTSQKDLYESGDLPEDDQNWQPKELASESVERDTVSAKDARKKFNTKYVSGADTDFSGKIGARAGYDTGDFVIAGKDEIETPTQKFQRLKAELSALARDLKSDATGESVPPADLVEQVQQLQVELQSQELTGSYATGTFGKVMTYLDEISSSPKASKPAAKSEQQEAVGTYSLMIRPDEHQRKFGAKLTLAEQRIAKLEKAIGLDSQQLSVLTAQTKTKNLKASVDALLAQRSVLDPDLLPQVDTRLQAVLNKLNDINKAQKQKGAEEATSNKKVLELYDTVQKWDSVCNCLPEILHRMETLDDLHQQAADFASTIAHMEAVQGQISTKLTDTSELAKSVQSVFKENTATIQGNVKALEKRIQSLGVK